MNLETISMSRKMALLAVVFHGVSLKDSAILQITKSEELKPEQVSEPHYRRRGQDSWYMLRQR